MKYVVSKNKELKSKQINEHNCANCFILGVRLLVCFFVIFIIFTEKIINNNYYNCIKQWYNFQINDSLVAGANAKNYNFCLRNVTPINLSVNISSPVKDGIVTSKFGSRVDPINKNIKNTHKGIDIASEFSNDIFSALPGVIKLATYFGDYGKCVIVDHGNTIQTLYAHCDKINVKYGDIVNKGQKIATVGTSGKSTGPHVHFEVIVNCLNLDPEFFLKNIHIKNDEF